MSYNLITVLGPRASGKTALAAQIANKLGSAIISADSRQVYRGMDIGTGKDLSDYIIDGNQVPYFLVDIADAGTKYNVYEFQKDFFNRFQILQDTGKLPVLCGGSGLYIEAVLKAYKMLAVPVNEKLRSDLESKSNTELAEILESYKSLHNKSDFDTRKRTIRAIEIEVYQKESGLAPMNLPEINSLLVGIYFERDELRNRITNRLRTRLNEGMIDEVQMLLNKGISADDLIYYGLEYKFITQYLTNVLSYDEMFNLLNIAIHQFSKRQMTWFRKMEREGFKINWLDGKLPITEKVDKVFELIKKEN